MAPGHWVALTPYGCAAPHGILQPDPHVIAPFMTSTAAAQNTARHTGKDLRHHLVPVVLAGIIATTALALVAYLLWPTWEIEAASGPSRLPVSIGSLFFSCSNPSQREQITQH